MSPKRVCCSLCGAKREKKRILKTPVLRGVTIEYMALIYECPKCGNTVRDEDDALKMQIHIAEEVREAKGMMTGAEIRKLRLRMGWTYDNMAVRLFCDPKWIKRWEKDTIQSDRIDESLRNLQSSARKERQAQYKF